MVKLASAAALLAAAGAAQAAFFEVVSVDTSSLGSPISYTGTLFNPAAGSTLGSPAPDLMDLQAALQYDSYVAIDVGPGTPGTATSGDGFHANPGDLAGIGNPFANAGQISALWFMDPQGPRPAVGSTTVNSKFDGADFLFLGRFVFRSSTGLAQGSLSLGDNGVVVDIRDPGTVGVGAPATDTLLVRFNAFNSDVSSGLDGGSLTNHPTAYTYQLRLNESRVTVGTFNYLVYDLKVVQIPTPGAIALFGAAGLAAARRRRA